MVVHVLTYQAVGVAQPVGKVSGHGLQQQLRTCQWSSSYDHGARCHVVRRAAETIEVFDTVDSTKAGVPGQAQGVCAQTQLEVWKARQAAYDVLEAVECGATAPDQPVGPVRDRHVAQTLTVRVGCPGQRLPPARQRASPDQCLGGGQLRHVAPLACNTQYPLGPRVVGSQVGVLQRPTIAFVKARALEEVLSGET